MHLFVLISSSLYVFSRVPDQPVKQESQSVPREGIQNLPRKGGGGGNRRRGRCSITSLYSFLLLFLLVPKVRLTLQMFLAGASCFMMLFTSLSFFPPLFFLIHVFASFSLSHIPSLSCCCSFPGLLLTFPLSCLRDASSGHHPHVCLYPEEKRGKAD